ncbi:MAG: amidase family protein, partial [Chthoniobacterales bacterium]
MTAQDLPALTIAELQPLLRRGEISAREILESLRARINQIDGKIGAYLSLDFEAALREAEKVDVRLPLGGIPIALKDNINVADQPCTCASRILQNYRAKYDATVVRRLRAAGAIPFGKTNLDEFAMGSSTENSSVRTTMNPWDMSRVAGGSSGGSAAAVAADMAFAALGSDTGGSVRQPASLCGVVGLKPSYGRVSRFGLTAFASSLDQIGPFGKNVREVAILLQALAGHDARDSTCLDAAVPDYSANLGKEIRGMRIGVVKEHDLAGLDPRVKEVVATAVKQLHSLGAEIVDVSFPLTDYAVAVYYVLATAEASANLARFDGVRYGHRAANPQNLLDFYERTRAEGFGAEVKRRVILG